MLKQLKSDGSANFRTAMTIVLATVGITMAALSIWFAMVLSHSQDARAASGPSAPGVPDHGAASNSSSPFTPPSKPGPLQMVDSYNESSNESASHNTTNGTQANSAPHASQGVKQEGSNQTPPSMPRDNGTSEGGAQQYNDTPSKTNNSAPGSSPASGPVVLPSAPSPSVAALPKQAW